MRAFTKSIVVAMALSASASALASPIVVDYTDILNNTLPAGVTVSSIPNDIGEKCTGVGADLRCGVGVEAGPAGNETDAPSQSITFDFTATGMGSTTVKGLSISALYMGPAFRDPQIPSGGVTLGEKAQFDAVIGGMVSTAFFQVARDEMTDEIFGIFSGDASGSASFGRCDDGRPDETSSSACWNLYDVFGDADITELTLSAVDLSAAPAGFDGNNTDYLFRGINTVPEPGIVALLGLSLLGLALWRRRVGEAV